MESMNSPPPSIKLSSSSPAGRDDDSLGTPRSREDEDESDISDEESEESEAPDVCDEPIPEAPVYDQALQRGLSDVKKQLAQLASTMQNPETKIDTDSGLLRFLPEVESLSKFQSPKFCTVGFIGTSGEGIFNIDDLIGEAHLLIEKIGKSSVINSLLDKVNLARASGSGRACTSVVTEFRYVNEDHPGPYSIEAIFMSPKEVTELLEELLRSFRLYYCEASFKEISTEEQKSLRYAASSAEDTLESLFGSQPGWNEDFLRDETEGAEKDILAKLEEWAELVVSLRPSGTDSLVYTTVAKNLRRCTETLDHLVAETYEDGKPALWPFIKLLRVYLKAPILRLGLVIADLPGFRDLNYARVIYADEESRGGTLEAQKVRKMARRLQRAQDNFERARKCSRNTKFSQGGSEATQLMDKVDSLQIKLTEFMVGNRNKRVRYEIGQKYTFVKVFCVSNTLYATHRKGEGRFSGGYIKLSGINELREHCQLVPAGAQLRSTVAYLNHQVPALLGSLRQWALAGADLVTGNRAASLRATLKQVEAIIQKKLLSTHGCIEQVKRKLIDLFELNILREIMKNEAEWTKKSVEDSDNWADFHHMTFGAICRHNGKWTIKSQGLLSVNEELIKYPKEILTLKWTFLCECTVKWAMVSGTDSSIMANIMRSVYLSCSKHTGKGSDKRRKDEMREFLMSSQMFLKYHHLTKSIYFKKINKRFKIFQKEILEEVEKIVRDLNMVVADEGEVLEAAQKPTLAGMVKAGVETAQSTLSRAQFDLGIAMGEKRD
ncbi:hypothetical protein N7454_002869 [Penicillium verhagenii]|nr:hypothetical protein N7454_002869 [Penicillium verhagenii]